MKTEISKNELKKCYQPRTDLIIDESGDVVADSHNMLNRWKNYFCQLLTVHGLNDVRRTEMHTTEPLVPEPSYFEVEIDMEKLRKQISRY
jgi:hypothetical protein